MNEPELDVRDRRLRSRARRIRAASLGPLDVELERAVTLERLELERLAREYDRWLERELRRLEAELERELLVDLLRETAP